MAKSTALLLDSWSVADTVVTATYDGLSPVAAATAYGTTTAPKPFSIFLRFVASKVSSSHALN